jgi:hypothetical protein
MEPLTDNEFVTRFDSIIDDLVKARNNTSQVLVITVDNDGNHMGHLLGDPEILADLAISCGEELVKGLAAPVEDAPRIHLLN